MSGGPGDERYPLLRGQGRFIDDLRPPGCLHLAFVRSPYAAARIVGVDAAAARRAPGVAAVLTARDLDGQMGPIEARMDEADWYAYRPTAWPALAGDRVRFAGEAVAAVAAADPYRAEDACALVAVDYEPGPVVADMSAALAAGAPRVHAEIADNVMFRSRHAEGAGPDPIAAAPFRAAGRFRHPRLAPAPIECGGCAAVHDRRTGVTDVWLPSQVPHMARDGLARFLGLPESALRVIPVDIGGGFGVKMPLSPEELVTVFAARRLGRPVRWTQDRGEHLRCAFHARDAEIEAELAADGDGRIVGLRVRLWCDSGAYSPYPLGCSLEPHTAMVGFPGPYVVPWYEFEAAAVATNKCPTGPYRGVGFALAPVVTELLVDELARRCGRDRAELRRRNMVAPDSHPFRSASGAVLDSGDYPALIDAALEAADAGRPAALGAPPPPGKRRGVGIACFIEPTGMGCNVFRGRGMREIPAFDSARVRVGRSGAVEATVTVPAMGQLPFNTMRKLLAARLGLPVDSVAVGAADTQAMPFGSGAFASRGLVSGGGALLRAADRTLARMTELAALLLDVAPSEIRYADGRFGGGRDANRFATFAEIAEFAHAPQGGLPPGFVHGLETAASYDNPGAAVSAAVHVAVVDVDSETGAVEIRDYVVAEDCGPVADLATVEAQIHGAVVQGVGAALMEEMRYDGGGQLATASFADYLLPGAFDGPRLRIVHRETPSPLTEGGYKGMGESGTIGAPAAIAGAVVDAVGLEGSELRLPLTPERLAALAAPVSGPPAPPSSPRAARASPSSGTSS